MAAKIVERLCEWSSVHLSPQQWPREKREAVARAAAAWKSTHHLNALPLAWSGADGCTLQTRQWVGVVEIEDATIEIYPKLDKSLLQRDTLNGNSQSESQPGTQASSILGSLLWMLEVAGYSDIVETDVAGLDHQPLTHADLWAYLLAKHLRHELQMGLAHAYADEVGDLRAVRGRIQIMRQVGRNWNRLDRIACAWDEWTPDTPLNRLLKCACRLLTRHTSHPDTHGLLFDCLFLLDEVADVPPETALRETNHFVHTRATERLRPAFDLARRLLSGRGPTLGAGDENTWVFLVDMNVVFEMFCHAVLQAHFKVNVKAQERVGTLFRVPTRIQQKADFYWQADGCTWIGDAKYKHLLPYGRFDELVQEDEDAPDTARSGKFLTPNDVRQLTVYAQLDWQRQQKKNPAVPPPMPSLVILYPFVGAEALVPARYETWNDAQLWLVPVRVINAGVSDGLQNALPELTPNAAATATLTNAT